MNAIPSKAPGKAPGKIPGRAPSRVAPMSAGIALIAAGTALDGLLLGALVTGTSLPLPPLPPWPTGSGVPGAPPGSTVAALAVHATASLLAGTGVATTMAARTRTRTRAWLALGIGFCAVLPVVGGAGLAGALLARPGVGGTSGTQRPYWRVTEPVALPFTPPRPRAVPRIDARGLGEQLRHSTDNDALYRRLLAASSMRDSLAIGSLRAAVTHADDRIRLTAYQMMDTKVTRLNLEIQRLEAGIERLEDRLGDERAGESIAHERSSAWLQVAANYRELLTLEEAEPVARRQLLDRAVTAAERAVEALPSNRNAHLVLGRVRHLRGDGPEAEAAYERAIELGMSRDTVSPWLAQSAFEARDFARVRRILSDVGTAYRTYPPLRRVAEYWS